MKYCLAEDSDRYRFAPFTLNRPADTLRMGTTTFYEKWLKELDVNFISRSVPFPLSIAWQTDTGDADVYLNPRILPNKGVVSAIQNLNKGERLLSNDGAVIAVSPRDTISNFVPIDQVAFEKELYFDKEIVVLNHVWELMQGNGAEIVRDFNRFGYKENRWSVQTPGVFIAGEHPVFIHPTAKVEPGVFLLSYDGPIIIEAHAHIMSGNHLRGPIAIGEYSVLKMGGHLYGETSIGPHCRVGGEIKSTIFHSYSNKAHGGYIGNAIIGEWCNWGADTNCSNLKNNYGTVRVATFPDGKTKDTGMQFVGVMMGDHTKTSINTAINTGSVFGVMCNIALSSFPPKFLPSFTWLIDGATEKYSVEKALETARHIMGRRNIEMSVEQEELLRHLHKESV